MGVVNTTYTFTGTDTITSSKLNNIIDETTFTSDAISGTTLQIVSPGKLAVKASGITSNELASNSVTTAKITDSNVTTAKLANSSVTADKLASSAVTTAKIANSNVTFAKLDLPTNFPIQVKQAVKDNTQTIAGSVSTWTDISGLSVTLTRAIASASGKVRIQAVVNTSSNDGDFGIALRIVRGSTVIDNATGDAAGSRTRATSNSGYAEGYGNMTTVLDYIDSSPGSTATVTYKIQARIYSGATGYINRSFYDTDVADYVYRTISTLTLTELAP